MKSIYAEIHNENSDQGNWRAGVLVKESGLASCPGWDTYHETREEAVKSAIEMMYDYAAESEEQGETVEICGLVVMGL
jgi:hypothetical protein